MPANNLLEIEESQSAIHPSRWGWTRRGDGWVSQRETTLAQVVAGMLTAPDAWGRFADVYLRELDSAAERERVVGGRRRGRQERDEDLSAWHDLMRERLAHGEYEHLLDKLAHHPALARPVQ